MSLSRILASRPTATPDLLKELWLTRCAGRGQAACPPPRAWPTSWAGCRRSSRPKASPCARRDFDFDAWIDPRPLAAAHALLQQRRGLAA